MIVAQFLFTLRITNNLRIILWSSGVSLIINRLTPELRIRNMVFDIITIFPDIFASYFNESIVKRAQEKKLVKINIHNLRDYAKGRHRQVDDRTYGGGPGMILMVEPIFKAVAAMKKLKTKNKKPALNKVKGSKVILLSPKGKKFDQKIAQRFSKLDRLILICGRYEGVDERVAQSIADEEISIGDYVLTGGELPAMVIVDAVSRLIPGVIKKESLKEESFGLETGNRKQAAAPAEYPQYTRPEDFRGRKVPKILLSGHHKKIKEWRERKRG